jgi:hypothetical protein
VPGESDKQVDPVAIATRRFSPLLIARTNWYHRRGNPA